MTYASQLSDIAAAYKAEIRERERRNWQKWLEFRERIAKPYRPKPKEQHHAARS